VSLSRLPSNASGITEKLTVAHHSAGFIVAMTGISLNIGWTRTFQVTWIVGYCGGGFVYWLICLVSPPPGKPYVLEHMHVDEEVVEGVPSEEEEPEAKGVATSRLEQTRQKQRLVQMWQ
jgi:hypothetical protein